MAAARTMTDPRIVSLVLHHLSDMKYKDRRQGGPDQPVEFLEFRPTLVPSILVNKLWAEQGTTVLWRRYPHLPALQEMPVARRQRYADKVERLFVSGPNSERVDLDYLEGLKWPKLKTLELEADWKQHGKSFAMMLHPGLKHLEFSGSQSGDSRYLAETVFPALCAPCIGLQSIHIGPDAINPQDPVHSQELIDLLESIPTIKEIRIMHTNFFGKDLLFGRLSQRPGLEALEVDLDPGRQLESFFLGHQMLPNPFASLKRLHIICYPEIALALLGNLALLEELHLDVARVPDQPAQTADVTILDDILSLVSRSHELHTLRINIGRVASNFPSTALRPTLSGLTLIKLATGCPKLRDINLLASEPAAINASTISSRQFETFCRKTPDLQNLSLKLHPQTAIDLESNALQSLGKYCPQLETLRLKISLQLPNLQMPSETPIVHIGDGTPPSEATERHSTSVSLSIAINGNQWGSSSDLGQSEKPMTTGRSLFPHLTHFAFSRPQTILSIANDTYAVSSSSLSNTSNDALVEESLVCLWAQPLLAHFPRLEILESWSDWTGQDNESLNYYLPLDELLASTWEFLSGVEQDLWDDGDDESDTRSVDRDGKEWDRVIDSRLSFVSLESGDDWERASLVNEYPVGSDAADSGFLNVYDDEPEGMITPGRTIEHDDDFFHVN